MSFLRISLWLTWLFWDGDVTMGIRVGIQWAFDFDFESTLHVSGAAGQDKLKPRADRLEGPSRMALSIIPHILSPLTPILYYPQCCPSLFSGCNYCRIVYKYNLFATIHNGFSGVTRGDGNWRSWRHPMRSFNWTMTKAMGRPIPPVARQSNEVN